MTIPDRLRQDDAPRVFAALGLDRADREALRRQGFVAPEYRRGRVIGYKLRFRRGGRQVVRYIGSDPGRVEQVRTALARWQEPHRRRRARQRLVREAAKLLKDSKAQLAPVLDRAGFAFHGLAIRRRRRASMKEPPPTTP